ncbi:lysoplasmalogenase family protein [Pontixanthobacter sp.]|uniref:lysoplasmalogenase family protein n=1 Tax=Pontixanthobacter sp. TaxID=2792078 RepID=UPI003C7BAC7A
MVKRALTEKRPWLLTSVAAAAAFFILDGQPIGGVWLLLLKGAAAALLSVYAWQRHRSTDAKLLALVMAFSAAGDMLMELSLVQGGAAFFLAHIAAIILYLRNRRHDAAFSQKAAAAALLILTPWVCWLLSEDIVIAFYGAGLGAMAAAAWTSRFSRYRVGIGALLFVISDWLIFAGSGAYSDYAILGDLVWPIYYLGQFLIATGVIQTLRKELEAAA